MKYINGALTILAIAVVLLASYVLAIYTQYYIGLGVGVFTHNILGVKAEQVGVAFAWMGAFVPLVALLGLFFIAVSHGYNSDVDTLYLDVDTDEFDSILEEVNKRTRKNVDGEISDKEGDN